MNVKQGLKKIAQHGIVPGIFGLAVLASTFNKNVTCEYPSYSFHEVGDSLDLYERYGTHKTFGQYPDGSTYIGRVAKSDVSSVQVHEDQVRLFVNGEREDQEIIEENIWRNDVPQFTAIKKASMYLPR